MKKLNSEKGFTLIELLLVVVIIGLMLAVIVPRAWRANIDAKYGLVRQNCSELASFGQEWAENQLLAQNETYSYATIDDYLQTLAGNATYGAPGAGVIAWAAGSAWVADTVGGISTNWSVSGAGGIAANQAGQIAVDGRAIAAAAIANLTGAVPETTVEGVMPPEKVIRNPFNEVNVFQTTNDPVAAAAPVTGAIACGTIIDVGPGNAITAGSDNWHYYGFVFQGTDTTSSVLGASTAGAATGNNTFYSGQADNTLNGLRNGIFFARVRPGIN
jgi:prepilin-type N-terminal cleavage/methylation domain-containing protein